MWTSNYETRQRRPSNLQNQTLFNPELNPPWFHRLQSVININMDSRIVIEANSMA